MKWSRIASEVLHAVDDWATLDRPSEKEAGMSEDSVTRRTLLGGASLAAVAMSLPARAEARTTAERRAVPTPPAPATLTALLRPLGPGSRLGAWKVETIHDVEGGAASVILSDAQGIRFQVDVCALDPAPGAARGPARSEHFELFLSNRGSGCEATHEDHGLAAMALSEVIRSNESSFDRSGFLPLSQRSDPRRHVR